MTPAWLGDALAASAPLLALAGVLVGHWIHRRSARELDMRWRREETMRILRWAVDKTVDQDDTASRSGVVVFEAYVIANSVPVRSRQVDAEDTDSADSASAT